MKLRTSGRSRNVVLEMEHKDSALPAIAIPELRLKRILAPVDFSECSHKAFQYALHFAKQFNAEVLLLHVTVFLPPPPELLVFESGELTAKYREQAAKQLCDWRKEGISGLTVKAVTRAGGSAHQEIIEAARECYSDLIVIGNHGRTGLSRLLIGGTAERVVRHAPCPVLVIRAAEHDFIPGTEAEPG